MNIKLLRNKNFSLLIAGKFISLLGTQMQDFVLSLYVLKQTGSATLFGSVLIAALIPQLLFSPFAGVIVDWMDRKKIIVYLDLLSGTVVGLFAFIYLTKGTLSLTNIYVLVIALTLISAFYQPAAGTIIPSVIEKDDLVDANGINSLITNMGNLIAPLVAGALFGFYGMIPILVLNSFSFIAAAFGELFININKVNKMPEKISFQTFKSDFDEGIKFIKDRNILLQIIILAPIINFVFDPLFSTGLTYITKKLLQVSDFEYGLMQMIIVASMLLSPFIASKYAKKYTLGKILFIDVLISSLLIGIMAVVSSPIFIGLFSNNLIPFISIISVCFIIGMVISTANIALSSLFQKIVPISMMGRVGTVMNTFCMAIVPLGLLIFGFLFDIISAWVSVSIASFILLTAILCFRKTLFNSNDDIEISIATKSEFDAIK